MSEHVLGNLVSATVGTAWNQRTCKHLTESSDKF